MKKQGDPKETKELPQMSQEDFLERFYDGKISYKLPSKYPENFSLCKSYTDGKKEIPLNHKDKVNTLLKDAYNAVKPIVKKFKLSLALLVESNVTYKGVAWTKRIRIDFSMPSLGGKREELIAYTSMIQIKIRNPEAPQNPKKFLNKTTILAIMLHEFAHTRHMHHRIEFALFLKEMFEYAMTLGIFPEGEEHMIPSSRAWERRMFETKGSMSREELEAFFEKEPGHADHSDGEHGEDWEHEGNNKQQKEETKMVEEETKVASKSAIEKGKSKTVSTTQNKNEIKKQTSKVITAGSKDTASKTVSAPKRSAMEIENKVTEKQKGNTNVNGKTEIRNKKVVVSNSKKSSDTEPVKEEAPMPKFVNDEKEEKKEDCNFPPLTMEIEAI